MNTHYLKIIVILACLVILNEPSHGQTTATGDPTTPTASSQIANMPPPTAYEVVSRDANSRVWQRQTYEKLADGTIVPHVHKYVELASGMCYQANGTWQDSEELIEPHAGGAVARHGSYQVIFADNLNSAGAIDQQTPDGKRLRSNILGLAYYDQSSGQSVMIAQIQDSLGELISSNQVLYSNAFSGVLADVRYTYKKGSFEQDVILREQPPSPESLGLSSKTTEIEVLTEFVAPPPESIIEHKGPNGGPIDQDISWGAMRLGRGRAFDLGDEGGHHRRVPVRRQYATMDNRKILLEIVPFNKIQASLQSLPTQSSIESRQPIYASQKLLLPKSPMIQAKLQPMRLASSNKSNGFVLDYVELNSGQNDFTFQGDTTYLVDGNFTLTGTTVIEGGAVIKADNNGQINIDASGNIVCKTAPYSPAVFTSLNDDATGEGAFTEDPYYNGNPSYTDVYCYLNLDCSNAVLSNLRFHYAEDGAVSAGGGIVSSDPDYWPEQTLDIWDSQFINMDCVIAAGNILNLNLHNVLFTSVGLDGDQPIEFPYAGGVLTAEQCTFDLNYPLIYYDGSDPIYTYVTNSIVTGSDLGGATLVSSTGLVIADSGSYWTNYQAVGGGSYYLATNSIFRSRGTTNISPFLLNEIRQKTTYPPVIIGTTNSYLGTISSPTIFTPHALRDTNANPDLGYHYDPLDYIFVAAFADTTLAFEPGTAAAWAYDAEISYGLVLRTNGSVNFMGTAEAPCHWTRFNTVQETYGSTSGYFDWSPQSYQGGICSATPFTNSISAQFTICSMMAGEEGSVMQVNDSASTLQLKNCEFWTCWISCPGNENIFNCLFVNGTPLMGSSTWNSTNFLMENCTVFRGLVYSGSEYPFTISNCAFDSTTINTSLSGVNTNLVHCDYNSFLLNSNRTAIEGSHDVTVTNSYDWEAIRFGGYYLPTNSPLIDKGSSSANLLGLYHFTTQTNQAIEGDSTVDIGYHYVATDGNGNPLDGNGDGVPDYIEDANGDGLVDNGETNWALSILTQPTNQMVVQGFDAEFLVIAGGISPMNYQWYFGTNALAGATNFVLALTSVQNSDSGVYSVIVSNFSGVITSSPASLIVTDFYNGVAPDISVAPGVTQDWHDYYSGGAPVPLRVIVSTTNGVPIAGAPLVFSITNGTALLSLSPGSTSDTRQQTFADSSGTATVYFNLPFGTFGGTNEVLVAATSSTNTSQIVFNESTLAPPMIAANSGSLPVGFLLLQTPLGTVFALGDDSEDQLTYDPSGIPNFYSSIPLLITNGISNVVQVVAGVVSGYALDINSNVWAWGDNTSGELGNTAAGNPELVPIEVEGLTNVVSIAAGNENAGAIEADGSVWIWGGPPPSVGGSVVGVHPFFVGGGSGDDNNVPVQENGITNAIALSFGDNHALVLLSNQTVVAWGDNGYGQLGDGTTEDNYTPTAIPGLSNIVQIAACQNYSLALQSNGVIWSWGDNNMGQLGTGSSDSHNSVPTPIVFPTNIVKIAAGYTHVLALGSDGTVWAWGDNTYGELGIPSIVGDTNQPNNIPFETNIVSISAGSSSSFVIDSNEHVWGWGVLAYPDPGSDLTNYPSPTNMFNLATAPFTKTNPCTIEMTYPTNALVLNTSEGLTVKVTPWDSYGFISMVNFYFNGALVGTSTNYPYTFIWTNLPAASGYLQSQAIDSGGNASNLSESEYLTIYLSSNILGIPDYILVGEDNDPLDPWTAPPPDPSDHTPPSILLKTPANTTLIP